jgi:phenylpropionate dioxygenase-like ring-hydroxylating dioxygenase large terminal subunit
MKDTRSLQDLIADRKPGWALDQRFYTDPDMYELELQKILLKNWFIAGHVSQIPDIGDFIVARLDKESAIIVRGSDGEVKAFANVCRHRGSLVCLQDAGSVKKFECPYHGWMYDIDGNLVAARSMPEGFDRSPYSLKSVSIDVIAGLIFICFSESPPSLAAARKDLAAPFELFGFDKLKLAAKKSYAIEANWKLAIENYQECYHCASAHPEYARMHTLMLDPAKRDRIQDKMLARFDACGLREIDIDFIDTLAPAGEQGYGYCRTAMFEGYKTGSRDGEALAPLLGNLKDYDNGASDFTVGPFSFLLAYSDHVVAYVFTPVDARNCKCEIYWLVRDDAVEATDYNVDDLTWLWDITTHADKSIIVNNWKGVQSVFYEPGPFSRMEEMESRYIDWIIREMAEANAGQS